ncbi:hypothetical protein ACYOEI_07775 [Singulisphaera rosea]
MSSALKGTVRSSSSVECMNSVIWMQARHRKKSSGGGIREEWKSSLRIFDLAAHLTGYFLLIEEETGVRSARGFIATEDGACIVSRIHRKSRQPVLRVADQIRASRR